MLGWTEDRLGVNCSIGDVKLLDSADPEEAELMVAAVGLVSGPPLGVMELPDRFIDPIVSTDAWDSIVDDIEGSEPGFGEKDDEEVTLAWKDVDTSVLVVASVRTEPLIVGTEALVAKIEPLIIGNEVATKLEDCIVSLRLGNGTGNTTRALYANIMFGLTVALPNTTELRS